MKPSKSTKAIASRPNMSRDTRSLTSGHSKSKRSAIYYLEGVTGEPGAVAEVVRELTPLDRTCLELFDRGAAAQAALIKAVTRSLRPTARCISARSTGDFRNDAVEVESRQV